ncbi:hypothetical protein LV476_02050 [Guyparkeria hydrothermalis]|uniref:ShlB/FhaC/HecB family hemolysin secretion/activation protein n=1 Tax=Guyparkeria hydrothermalis TaxID=923 RepID=UPI002021BE23|nr:POTRA domain-containing protein [Guyparkeria hydrothermalis]MCL7743734.1 hypothetical protein [Guyparkeria hydrothermalis]
MDNVFQPSAQGITHHRQACGLVRSGFRSLCLAILATLAPAAYGQSAPDLIDEQHPTQEMGADNAPSATAESTVSLPGATEGVDPATVVKVTSVRFMGGNVFPLEALARDFQGMIGKTVTVERISAAVEDITHRYHDAGYPLSYAYLRNRKLDAGILEVVLVEGYVARTELEIEDPAVRNRVEALAERVVGERPLTRETFERYTALMNRMPGVNLKVNAPVPRTPNGATTLRVVQSKVDHVQPRVSVSGDNVDEYRVLGGLALQSNTRYAEKLSVAALVPTGDDRYYAAEYQQDIGSDGWRASASASRYEAEEVGVAPWDADIRLAQEKRVDRYRVGAEYPIKLGHRHEWSLSGYFGHIRDSSRYGIGDRLTVRNDIDYSVVELGTVTRRLSDSTLLELKADIRQGVDVGHRTDDFYLQNGGSRESLDSGHDLDFTRLGIESRWKKAITTAYLLDARWAMFWSDDSLPPTERGNYGGRRFGRGYSSGQAEGDYGAGVMLEARRRFAVDMGWVSRVEPYVVADAAHTRFHESDVDNNLASVGVGVELVGGDSYRLGIEYAKPVGDRDVETGNRDGRINARFSWSIGQ